MKENEHDLQPGNVVQLSPDCGNPLFAMHFMVVETPKPWGAQGYVLMMGENKVIASFEGRAYYRAQWEEMELIGHAKWWGGILNEGSKSPATQKPQS